MSGASAQPISHAADVAAVVVAMEYFIYISVYTTNSSCDTFAAALIPKRTNISVRVSMQTEMKIAQEALMAAEDAKAKLHHELQAAEVESERARTEAETVRKEAATRLEEIGDLQRQLALLRDAAAAEGDSLASKEAQARTCAKAAAERFARSSQQVTWLLKQGTLNLELFFLCPLFLVLLILFRQRILTHFVVSSQ